jgi:hypothetical protein
VSQIVQNFIKLAEQNKLQGIYENVPEAAYNHPDFPGIRSGFLKKVIKESYYHATQKKDDEDKPHFINGRIFHSVMEGVSDTELRKIYNIIGPDIEHFRHMSNSVRSHKRFEECHRGSMREVTMFATCRYTGLLLRCRCDLWNPSGLITDYKTAEKASLDGFTSSARRNGYRMSACFYAAVTSWATGINVGEFRMIAVEKDPPYLCAHYSYSSDSFELDTESMVRGLNQIKQARLGGPTGYTADVIELRY